MTNIVFIVFVQKENEVKWQLKNCLFKNCRAYARSATCIWPNLLTASALNGKVAQTEVKYQLSSARSTLPNTDISLQSRIECRLGRGLGPSMGWVGLGLSLPCMSWRISAILDCRDPIMGSLKSPCTTSYWSLIETIALNCLVFEKIAFLHFGDRQTYRQTNGQTDGHHRCVKPQSRCRELRLNNYNV